MSNRKSDRSKHKHHKSRRDFWRSWRDHRHEIWEEHRTRGPGFGLPPSPRMMGRFWREYFHDFMGTWPEDHWAFGGRRFSPWRQGRENFNPLVASLLSKGGGLLPLFVLHLLSQGSRYGNEIMETITERTGGGWLANPGAIYPLMTMLEAQELVSGEWEDPRKRTVRVYELTEIGKKELGRVKAIIRPKLQETINVLEELSQDLDTGDEEPEEV